MKTSELTGSALDWAVAKCEGENVRFDCGMVVTQGSSGVGTIYRPSTDWSQGGPIIESYEIDLKAVEEGVWEAANVFADLVFHHYTGPTPLIAAMRCFVASRLGDEVEIPEELQGELA